MRWTLGLSNGRTFHVVAEHNSVGNVYIQSAMLNGRPLRNPVITYKKIMSGATLSLVMGAVPSQWAADWTPLSLRQIAKDSR